MSTPSSYRIFLSATSHELASYREEVARVLRRKKIEVREQEHFQQGGATLLEKLHDYIAECDAVICLIGDHCGSLPTDEHMVVMGDGEWITRFHKASAQQWVSYTQWEFVLAMTLNKTTYVYLTDTDFIPDNPSQESDTQQRLQAAYRSWVKQTGKHREPLTTTAKLIEDVLVLPFPDLAQSVPNNLPYWTLGSLFKGRGQFLCDLQQQLGKPTQGNTVITNKTNPQRPLSVHGAGGIGKTRVAIEYAWRYASDYTALFFLSAESPQALNTSLANLSKVLPIDGIEAAPDDHRIKVVLNWLQVNPGWLVILDNVDTEESVVAVKERLAQLAQGHVLITSRLSQWSAGVKTMDLDVLSIEDATNYLLEATEANRLRSDKDAANAEKIVIKVGRLALGLEHAAAWINAQYRSFGDYLQQWEQDEAGILEVFDENLIEYPRELIVTWRLSVKQLDDDARQLLEVLSWLSPDPIPDECFQSVPDDAPMITRQAMASLSKYSLASRIHQDQHRGFQVHRLVQATTRYQQQQLKADNGMPALDLALTWLTTAFHGDPGDVQDWHSLDPLARMLRACANSPRKNSKRAKSTARCSCSISLGYCI